MKTNLIRDQLLTAFVVAVTLIVIAASTTLAREPSMDDILTARAEALAQSYLLTNNVLDGVINMVEMGVVDTAHVGGDRITTKNVARFRDLYEKRLQKYVKAMQERGSVSMAGTYHGEVTESCARSGSAWIGFIAAGDARGIRIHQDGFDARFEVIYEYEGKRSAFANVAAVVESKIVIGDAMNSDYFSQGQLRDGVITIHPSAEVLKGWPKWAGPPKRSDIEACTVTLTPVEVQPIS